MLKRYGGWLAVLAGLQLSCAHNAVEPGPNRPSVALPDEWITPSSQTVQTTSAGERWWMLFGDSVLDSLVTEALTNNSDVAIAAARVVEAQAQVGLARADQMPWLNLRFGADRTRSSERGTFPMPPGTPLIQNTFRATLETSYEIDLWGKYRATTAAARAELLATEEAHRTIQLSLVAAVAENYFSLLAADAQVELLQRTLSARGETLGLFKKRMTAGVSSEFHLFQAQAEEAAARSQLAGAKGQREQVDATMAVLLGRAPREVMQSMVERGMPVALHTFWVPSGLPSELLLRRPDVREAELRLRAADARISSVRAAMFPSIALTAMLGSESTDLSDLFSGPAGIFQFAVALVQPLFNAGRTKHAQERVKIQREMALTQYKKIMANAFGDVRKALAAQDAARQVFEAESQRAAALVQAHQHALRRLEGGVANRLEVLDVERQLLQAQLAQIEAARVQRSAVANLFKALGGGWAA